MTMCEDPFSENCSLEVFDLPAVRKGRRLTIVIMEERDVKPVLVFVELFEADIEHVRFLEIKIGGG